MRICALYSNRLTCFTCLPTSFSHVLYDGINSNKLCRTMHNADYANTGTSQPGMRRSLTSTCFCPLECERTQQNRQAMKCLDLKPTSIICTTGTLHSGALDPPASASWCMRAAVTRSRPCHRGHSASVADDCADTMLPLSDLRQHSAAQHSVAACTSQGTFMCTWGCSSALWQQSAAQWNAVQCSAALA